MDRVALGTLHRKTGYRDCLAPQGVPPVLDMEGPARAARAPINLQGGPETDSEDEPDNPIWGAARIHGELLKLGIDIGETSVSKYVVHRRNPPSQTGERFLKAI